MSTKAIRLALAELEAQIGVELQPTDWFEITQAHIDQFADATLDHQWIHVDEERAQKGPFGKTIAHGQLTLSVMRHLPRSAASAPPPIDGQKLRINYGFNRVRFPSPVPVGSQIRSKQTLRGAEIKGDMLEVIYEVVVEVKGQEKPACVAEALTRVVF